MTQNKNSAVSDGEIPIRTDHRTVRIAKNEKDVVRIVNKYKSTITPEDMEKLTKKFPALKVDMSNKIKK